MSIIFENDIRESSVKDVVSKMMLAARTAPKARGRDNIVIASAGKDEIMKISAVIHELAQREEVMASAYLRDAENILKAEMLFLIGTKLIPVGIDCGLCGFSSCKEKSEYSKQPCVFNTGDLGIALGSAISVAMDHRVDNRIMFTVGMAVRKLGLLGEDVAICYGVPLSATGKNVFLIGNKNETNIT